LDLTQIRYFLALSETLNFTRAAEHCNVTQPALTKSIQKLEDELGGPLLLRERRDSQLTALGQTMLPLMQRIFDAANAARIGAKDFHRQDVERLRVGLGPWVAPDSIVPILRELGARFPSLEVSVCSGSTESLSELLVGSEIDVALTASASNLTSRANSWALFEDDAVALLGVDHALALPLPLSCEALTGQCLVSRTGPEEAPQMLEGLPAPVRHRGASDEHVWMLLRAGLGVGLSTARRAVPPDIVQRPLHPRRSVAVHVAFIPGRRAAMAVDAFVRLARARSWELAVS
jgi:DNA-binding transcriptional LysR family regulator